MYTPITHDVSISVRQLAETVGGTLQGDSGVVVTGICPLNEPCADHLAFASGKALANLIEAHQSNTIAGESPACLLVPQDADLTGITTTSAFIRVENPQAALIKCMPFFYEKLAPRYGVSEQAAIHPSAELGTGVEIGPFVSVGAGVRIEDNVTIHPNCVIYPNVTIKEGTEIHSGTCVREGVTIGRHCLILNNTVIGAEGFGYIPNKQTGLEMVPQLGTVEIADRVDVGASSSIDRGALGNTRIGMGTKIDNQVQIGHNVEIGNFSIICGGCGIAGSTSIGDQCVIGGHVAIADHVTVAPGSRVAGNAGVDRPILEKGDYRGHPIEKDIPWRRQQLALRRLPELLKRVKRIEKLYDKESG